MPRPPSTWKGIERFVAKYLGGERTHWALEDVRAQEYNIEVKHGEQIPKFIRKSWAQATKNARGRQPLLVLHWPHLRKSHSLVVLRLDHFRELLDNVNGSNRT